MTKFIAIIFLCLLMGATSAKAVENEELINQTKVSPEDFKVIAEIETLQLMDLAEDMDMLKDIEYLIEDDKNETKNN